MNKLLVAFVPRFIGVELFSNFRNADASPFELPTNFAPFASARYSLDLEIASWIIVAAIGASITMNSMVIMSWWSLSFDPPNIIVHCATVAMYEITPPIVAAIVVISVSLFFMWAISCAATPMISSSFRIFSIPFENATAE